MDTSRHNRVVEIAEIAEIDEGVIDETGAAGTVTDEGTAAGSALIIEDEDAGETKKAKLPARATRNDDGSITLPLLRPVALTIKSSDGRKREEMLTELTFHEVNGADMRIVSQASEAMQGVVTFARATRMATNRMNVIFDRLVARDIKAGSDIISFLSE